MKLEDAGSEEEVQEALDAGDTALQKEIDDTVQSLLDLSLEHSESEWKHHGLDEWERLQQDAASAGVDQVILRTMKESYPSLFADIPEDAITEQLAREIAKGSHDFLQNGDTWGSKLMAFQEDDDPSDNDIVVRPTLIEMTVFREGGPLEYVPDDVVEEALSRLGPSGAEWADTGMGDYSSGMMNHPTRYLVVTPDSGEFYEWLVDQRTHYYGLLVDADPDIAVANFLSAMQRHEPELYKKIRKAKLPQDVLASYAVAFFEDQDDGMEVLREALGMWDYEGTRAETILEIDRGNLRNLGITSGRFWDGAPWKLLNLPPEELAYEGTLQRHCVGRYDMGYRDAVESGDIMIWSLRSQHNKPLLTFEVDKSIWDIAKTPEERGSAFEQIKGKLNRVAGENPEEAAVVGLIFDALDVDGSIIPDFQPQRAANPGVPRKTFDQPHQPRRAQPPRRPAAPRRPQSELQRYSDLKRRLMR